MDAPTTTIAIFTSFLATAVVRIVSTKESMSMVVLCQQIIRWIGIVFTEKLVQSVFVDRHNYILAVKLRRRDKIISNATALTPCGIRISATRFDGSTNVICIGRTVFKYCCITDSADRPRSSISRRNRRINRMSFGVSTKILISIRSTSTGSVKIKIPSTKITFFGIVNELSLQRVWVAKSYLGIKTDSPFRSKRRCLTNNAVSRESGWS